VAERIAAFQPDAYILYLMRDPIERTISNYWWLVQTQGERREPMTAGRENPDYCDLSHYAMQIEPYLSLFGRERVMCLTAERLAQAGTSTLTRASHWRHVAST